MVFTKAHVDVNVKYELVAVRLVHTHAHCLVSF